MRTTHDGLIHADFLPDNIIVNEDRLTLIDYR